MRLMMKRNSLSYAQKLSKAGLIALFVIACLIGSSSSSFARTPLASATIEKSDEIKKKPAPSGRLAQRRKPRQGRRGYNNQQSRKAVSAGKALSLSQVARNVRRRVPGQLLDAQLVNGRGGRLVYRLKILGKNGVMRNVTADAHSGGILSVR